MTPLEALQATLAAEHAAVHLLGVVGARVSVSAEPKLWDQVRDSYTAHLVRRDEAIDLVRRAGGDPVPAEVSYELPFPATTPERIRRAALEIESGCTGVYADAVGSTARAQRRWALDALQGSAVRQLAFGGRPEAFPGAAEL